MAGKKKSKERAEFRKNRTPRARQTGWTRQFESHGFADKDTETSERVSGKGELTRKRTVAVADSSANTAELSAADQRLTLRGRVISMHGLTSVVEADDGQEYRCATRRVLKTLATNQRHILAAGDIVQFRPAPNWEGLVERVEPRYGVLSRQIRGRQQILVANVDLLLIIGSVAEPYLKPNLIDRFLVAAEKAAVQPLICLNKIDLVEPSTLAPVAGVYSQMGYRVLLTSATTGFNIDRLRQSLAGRQSVLVGQSGVGKSSLMNAVEPGLGLRVSAVSAENKKGRHTTTSALLLRLADGGHVIDTPGLRQFQLWDTIPQEVAGLYRDIRPLVSHCGYPDCTHIHEQDCAVKNAVADGRLDSRRYESYCHLFAGDWE